MAGLFPLELLAEKKFAHLQEEIVRMFPGIRRHRWNTPIRRITFKQKTDFRSSGHRNSIRMLFRPLPFTEWHFIFPGGGKPSGSNAQGEEPEIAGIYRPER